MIQSTYSSGLLFTRAHKAVRASIYEILEKYKLNPSYWSILGAAVESKDGIRLTNVAKIMDVKAPLVTMLATDLIEMGLINRLQHHTDKRAKLLVATPKGKRLAIKIETELSMAIAGLLHGSSEVDVAHFQTVLENILENAKSNEA